MLAAIALPVYAVLFAVNDSVGVARVIVNVPFTFVIL